MACLARAAHPGGASRAEVALMIVSLDRPGAAAGRLARRPAAALCGAALVLVPWTIYLDRSLAQRAVVTRWAAVWAGFDLVLAAALATTALALRRGEDGAERLGAL